MSMRLQKLALILGAAIVLFLGSRVCSRLLAQAPPPPAPTNDYAQPSQPAQSGAGEQAPAGNQAGPEVLTRGPVHEAFAEVISYDAKPGQIVAKEPPKAIEEVPPAEKPEGDYTWIPGYWAWDQDRENFIWVSGAWRIPPPSTTWVPGYWNQVANGYQWVGGYWGPAANMATAGVSTSETVYLPQPPQSVESGASTAPPSADHFWVPGYWYWDGGRYVWRAGYWGRSQEGWVWIPARYVWTPGGYVFIAGHWDYTLAKRGVVFCPVYYDNPYYIPASYYYSPTVCIDTPVLSGYLFCRPAYCHYYFGDYYDPMYVGIGIYPWYGVRGGYEPLFVYDRWYYGRRDPGWEMRMRGDYAYRVAHVDARPPHTYAAAMRLDIGGGGVRFTLAAPIGRVAARGGFERISDQRRGQIVRDQREMRAVQNDRRNTEIRAGAQARASGGQPVRMNVHTSAATTSRTATSGAARARGRSDGSRRQADGPRHGTARRAPPRTANTAAKNSKDKDKNNSR